MIKIAHIRLKKPDETINSNGGVTVAFEKIHESGIYKYAMAFCHPHDNFNKKLGRAKAIGRMKSKHFIQMDGAKTDSELIANIITELDLPWGNYYYDSKSLYCKEKENESTSKDSVNDSSS